MVEIAIIKEHHKWMLFRNNDGVLSPMGEILPKSYYGRLVIRRTFSIGSVCFARLYEKPPRYEKGSWRFLGELFLSMEELEKLREFLQTL